MLFSSGHYPFAPSNKLGVLDPARMYVSHRDQLSRKEPPDYAHLDVDTPPAMVDVISWMLSYLPAGRPTMPAVLSHPVFWHEVSKVASLCFRRGVSCFCISSVSIFQPQHVHDGEA